MKTNATYEKARTFFVENGFSINTILNLMAGEVSKKTLYNWKNEGNWDELRKKRLSRKESLEEDLYELLQTAITEAKANPDPRTLFSVAKLVGTLKQLQSVKLSDDSSEEEDKPKTISPDTIKRIEKEILGL